MANEFLGCWVAAQGERPSTSPAGKSKRGNIPIITMDDSSDEFMEFGGWMPEQYGGGGVTLTIGFMTASATSGSTTITGALKSVTNNVDTLDTKAFATAQTASGTAPTSADRIRHVTITFTDGAQMDSGAAGEYFRLQVGRDVTGNSLTGDIQVVFAALKESA